jgi:hypothetical protein
LAPRFGAGRARRSLRLWQVPPANLKLVLKHTRCLLLPLVRWTLSSRILTSMVSVGVPGMANSTTSLWFCLSAYATGLGATLIRSFGILAPSFYYSGFSILTSGTPTVYTQGLNCDRIFLHNQFTVTFDSKKAIEWTTTTQLGKLAESASGQSRQCDINGDLMTRITQRMTSSRR